MIYVNIILSLYMILYDCIIYLYTYSQITTLLKDRYFSVYVCILSYKSCYITTLSYCCIICTMYIVTMVIIVIMTTYIYIYYSALH